ncbi:UNVERIFIED_CONTAM: Bifunctional pinoresinol-lariciresinol reductase [Sesamum latifolium]|uniref:(+)-lariciresinol reductase n=1 Tax=Sesamum latifolium TaxID=2727402 RepID=A0AAW2SMT1_9LAMI
MLLSFKMLGAHLVPGSFADYASLFEAVKLVDVIVCAISGVHMRSHSILLQLTLVQAIKEAGNVKRFLPSEFGTDAARGAKAGTEPGKVTFEDKMVVRKAIEEAGIPFTYVSANCFAGYFVGGFVSLVKSFLPQTPCSYMEMATQKSMDQELEIYDCMSMFVEIGSKYVAEDDIATYTIKTIDDPRTLNKTLYIRPPLNILSQRQVVQKWEKLIGKELHKTTISKQDFLASMKSLEYAHQVGLCHYHDVLYEGCLTNFEIGEDGEEASSLYPEVKYTTVEEFLKRYV